MNQMQFLRRWATHTAGCSGKDGVIILTSDTADLIADGLLKTLSIIDKMWETREGRSLTEAEKFGTPEDHTIFDHVEIDCVGAIRKAVDE